MTLSESMAAEASRERELKLQAPLSWSRRGLERSLSIPEGIAGKRIRSDLLIDHYLDTPEHALQRAGFGLRLRDAPEGSRLTLKRRAAPHSGLFQERLELEYRLDGRHDPFDPEHWPRAIRRWIGAAIAEVGGKDDGLQPLAYVTHARQRRGLSTKAAEGKRRPLGELLLEEVAISKPARPGSSWTGMQPVDRFAEIEFELAPEADPESATRMAEHLLALDGLKPQRQDKLQTALRLIAAQRPGGGRGATGIVGDMAAAEAGRLYLHEQWQAFLLNEQGARDSLDIEHVHDMRVATRRANATLDLLQAHYEDDGIKDLKRGLRRARRVLGRVRDLDIGLEHLEGWRAGRGVDPRGLDALEATLVEGREKRQRQMVDWLSSKRHRRLQQNWKRFVQSPGASAVAAAARTEFGALTPFQLRHVLPQAVLSRYAIVRSYEVVLGRAEEPDLGLLHDLRIDCKALRYSLEPAQHLLGKPGQRTIRGLKALQTRLGDLNDRAVIAERLDSQFGDGLDAPGVQAYRAAVSEQIRALRRDVKKPWKRLTGTDFRRDLGKALARL